MVGSSELGVEVEAHRATRATWRAFAGDEEVAALVEQCAGAQQDAAVAAASLEQLIERCRPLVWRIARTYVANEADAADVVQEALWQAARGLATLQHSAAFPHWIATVVQNAARQWLRRERARQRERSLEVTGHAGFEDLPLLENVAAAGAFGDVEARDLLSRLLRLLSPRERAVLLLYHEARQSQQEIGRRLGLSPRAVEGTVYRATRRLRDVAAQCSDETEELLSWCSVCGRQRLRGRLQPGISPDRPLHLYATCPVCCPGNLYWISYPLPLQRHASLDGALRRGSELLDGQVRRLLRTPAPTCERCGAPLVHARFWDRAGYEVKWHCRDCAETAWQSSVTAVDSTLPAWRAFWECSSRLLIESQCLSREGGSHACWCGRSILARSAPPSSRSTASA